MRTLAADLIGVIIVLITINVVVSYDKLAQQHDLGVFSVGFVLGALGMLLAAYMYGYRKIG